MHGSWNGDAGDDETEDLDECPSDELVLDTEAAVDCPYCGETIVLGLDPGGGAAQEYIEDCQVCCRPCRVRVGYDDSGRAEVLIEAMQ